LTELLVELGSEVDRAAGEVERIMGALTMTESASDVAVERDICEPMGGEKQLGMGESKGWRRREW
jgi:hypothetical protein